MKTLFLILGIGLFLLAVDLTANAHYRNQGRSNIQEFKLVQGQTFSISPLPVGVSQQQYNGFGTTNGFQFARVVVLPSGGTQLGQNCFTLQNGEITFGNLTMQFYSGVLDCVPGGPNVYDLLIIGYQ